MVRSSIVVRLMRRYAVVGDSKGYDACARLLASAPTDDARRPQVGEALYLLPRHVCPSVNNFDSALLVRDGHITSVEKVSARGREAPLLPILEPTTSPVRSQAVEKI